MSKEIYNARREAHKIYKEKQVSSVSLEELKEKLRGEIVHILCPQFPYSLDDAQRAGKEADQIIQTFIQFCKERNIYQVVEILRPIKFFHPDDNNTNTAYRQGVDDTLKRHKQSLKPVSEVVKDEHR